MKGAEIDIIILDHDMPHEKSSDTAKKVQKHSKEKKIPMPLMVGHSSRNNELRETCLEASVDVLLDKNTGTRANWKEMIDSNPTLDYFYSRTGGREGLSVPLSYAAIKAPSFESFCLAGGLKGLADTPLPDYFFGNRDE